MMDQPSKKEMPYLLSLPTEYIQMEYDTQLSCILENENDWTSEADSIWLSLKDNIVKEGIPL
jgi:hypothetical protein